MSGGGSGQVPEGTLWSYVLQISSALKSIHNTGKACRVVDASKILITGQNRYARQAARRRLLGELPDPINYAVAYRGCIQRVRINGVGMADVVNFDATKNVAQYQVRCLVDAESQSGIRCSN